MTSKYRMMRNMIGAIPANVPEIKQASLLCWFSLLMLLPHFLLAQTADDQYRRPLEEVLAEIEEEFNIELRYPEKLVKDQWLPYADWRIRPYSLEETLTNVLAPFDLKFNKDSEIKYEIKPYEYHRRPVKEGRAQLEYLSTLYDSKESWESRKQELRACMRAALGLDQLTASPGSQPIVTSKREMDGYTVENVAIETLPGLYVTGSLYRPLKPEGLSPVILNPNGHFGDGRYRADQQYRCAMQARMGAIAFSYDLFAWGESLLQFEPEDHRNSMAHTIQALNGLRILDYLTSLPGADPDRVAVTGGSGGGSQTMLLTALDDRIKVSVPVVMVSSHMFGGCPCESGMPVHLCGGGTNNAEMAAMAAPRPQLILSDGKDWTHSVPDLEYPYIQKVYGLYDKEHLVENIHFGDEGHDYGFSKRVAMYEFMADHLDLKLDRVKDKKGKIDESGITIEEESALLVFGKDGERLPSNAIRGIQQLQKVMAEAREENAGSK